MIDFKLPNSTIIQRNIPKSSFDLFTNSKEKELFTNYISKITWKNSLSFESINLPSKNIVEIQIIHIELKRLYEISSLLNIIDKVIPYHIIFIVSFEDLVQLHTSPKHASVLNDSLAVIDWSFTTTWFSSAENRYHLTLSKSLDYVYFNFCTQLCPNISTNAYSIEELILYNKQVMALKKDIDKYKSRIKKSLQFNKKIELKLKITELEKQLNTLLDR